MHNERANVLDLSFGKLSLGNVREVILGRFWKFLTQINF